MNWDFDLNQALVDKHKDNFDKRLVELGILLDEISCMCNNTKVRNMFDFNNSTKTDILKIFFAIMCEVCGRNMSIVELIDIMQLIMRSLGKGDNLEHHYVIIHKLKNIDTSIFPSGYIADLYDEHECVLGTECVLVHAKKIISEIQFTTHSSKEELFHKLIIYAHAINERVKEDGFLKTISDKQLAVKLACEISGSKLGDDAPWYGIEVADG